MKRRKQMTTAEAMIREKGLVTHNRGSVVQADNKRSGEAAAHARDRRRESDMDQRAKRLRRIAAAFTHALPFFLCCCRSGWCAYPCTTRGARNTVHRNRSACRPPAVERRTGKRRKRSWPREGTRTAPPPLALPPPASFDRDEFEVMPRQKAL